MNAGTRIKAFATALAVIAGLLALASPANAAQVTLTGTVSVNGTPLSGGYVYFYGSCNDYVDGQTAGSALIEANGAYGLDLDLGTYVARIAPAPGSVAAVSWHNAARTCADATPITVTTSTTKDLNAARGVEVTGKAMNTEGIPVSSGRAVFFHSCRGFSEGGEKGSAQLNPDGSFAVTLPPGNYKVWIDAGADSHAVDSWNSAFSSCADTPVVTLTEPSTYVPLTARSGTLLTGTVTAAGVEQVSVNISFYDSCDDFAHDRVAGVASAFTGDYTVTLLPGQYKVRISPVNTNSPIVNGWNAGALSCTEADTVTVSGTTDTEPLTALTGDLVTGTVRNSQGTALTSGQVAFYRDCTAYRRDDMTVLTGPDQDGAYSVHLPPGDWVAYIEPWPGQPAIDSFHNAASTCASATKVDAPSAGPVDLVAETGASVSGIVRNSLGQAFQGGGVSFWTDCPGREAAAAQFNASRYQTYVAPGTYRVLIESADPNVSGQSWNGGESTCEDSTPVTVTGSTTDLDLTAAAMVSVSGTVTRTTATGTMPLSDTIVEFYADCGDRSSGGAYSQAGTYTAMVPVGTYRILLRPFSTQALTSWHNAKASCEKADPVTITGKTTDLQLVARSASVLSGQVRNAAGGEVDTGSLFFFTSCSGQPQDRFNIEEGSYRMPLPEGTYYVQIDPEDASAVTSWNGGVASCEQSTPVTVRGSTTKDLVAAVGTSLTGSVRISGKTVRGGFVDFYSDCNAGPLQSREILSDGTYEASLAPGRYRALIKASNGNSEAISWHDAVRTCAQATVIEVGQTPMKRNLQGLPTEEVFGSASSSNGPIAFGSVYFLSSCEAGTGEALVGTADINDGDYSAQLPPGTYYAWMAPYAGAAISWNGAKTACAQSTPVTVGQPQTYDLTAGYGVKMSGTVSSAAGPVKSGRVEFRRGCDGAPTTFAGSSPISRTRYAARVMPGTYRLQISPSPTSGAVESWHDAKKTCAEATALTISTDGTLDLRALKPSDPPGPGPAPGPGPTPGPSLPQSAKKPAAKLKKGKKAKLARATVQGSRLTWTSSTRKVCTVKKSVVTARKKGVCKVSAKAPAVTGFSAYSRTFQIRVR